MEINAFDNMDDFFDFAALDQGVEGNANTGSQQHQHEYLFCADNVSIMDWAMSPTVAIRSTDTVIPQDVHMHEMPKDFATDDLAQRWSSCEGSILSPNSSDAQTQGLTQVGAFSLPENTTCTEAALFDPPPSLSLPSYDQPDQSANDDGGSLDDALGARPKSSLMPPEQPAASSGQSPVPQSVVRHGSINSWKPASAKRKGPQSRIPLEAKQILEDEFAVNPYPCSWELDIIAHQANLEVKKVRNWYNNTRARKQNGDSQTTLQEPSNRDMRGLKSRLSKDSLESLEKQADSVTQPPQPPLAVYLAQSYQEEAVELSAVQAAIDDSSVSGSGQDDVWSDSWQGRRGSVITSVASSEGTAPTTYTVSSSGSCSNISSFGRDRRRGRRRMAWKESPRQAINGVNSAGEPQKDLPFFCTFCPRAFKTKYEWVRHEDSVHALRTTWICCDTKPSTIIQACPFCGQAHPDDAHMAGHKYQQCLSKPESQRTFYRRDHFIQHLHHVHFSNAKHPSVRVGCSARLLAAEGHNFGCKDLSMKWRRFGAPMKRDDPMLHCGFCGKKSKDWSERCEHVAEHLVARELNRAAWWGERKENHLENLYSASPYESFRCRYCQKIFTDIREMNEHSHCRVWSCRFLHSFDDVAADSAGPPLRPDLPSAKAHHCHLCGAGYRTFHVEHAQNFHRYRSCNQEFYTSEEAFLQHLHNFHSASQPTLLRGSGVIEQSFMRNKGASFEPVEFNESWQPCGMDLDVAPVSPFVADNAISARPPGQKKSQISVEKQPSVRKKSRDAGQHKLSPVKAQRPRSSTNSTTSKADTLNPRFFRLSTYVPFRSSRIFYAHHSKASVFPRDDEAVLEEIPKPHITSLVMSSGLVSMAPARWIIRPELQATSGMMELTLNDEADTD